MKSLEKVSVHCLGVDLKAVIIEKTVIRGNEFKQSIFHDNYKLSISDTMNNRFLKFEKYIFQTHLDVPLNLVPLLVRPSIVLAVRVLLIARLLQHPTCTLKLISRPRSKPIKINDVNQLHEIKVPV